MIKGQKPPPPVTYVGTRYGRLVTTENVTGTRTPVRCICDCGNEKRVTLRDIKEFVRRTGRSPSCGCATRAESNAAIGRPPVITPAGSRFGRVVLLETAIGTQSHVKCRCDCGTVKVIRLSHLKENGPHRTVSCGCAGIKHGHSKADKGRPTAEYRIWAGMLTRCGNPNNHAYANYGARGIRVCERWEEFANFLTDMGLRPSKAHSIERKDNEGPYEPDNCIWATQKQQMRNTRATIYLTVRGVTKPLPAWAEIVGLDQKVLRGRLAEGWSHEDTVDRPLAQRFAA